MGLGSTSHYDVLEIAPSSGEAEIKKAFHRIARQNHPDRAADGDVELFKRATIAYETLVDAEKRRAYDGELRRIEPWRWQPPRDFGGASPSRSGSATSNFFKAAFGEFTPRTPHTPSAEATAAAAAASAASRSEDATYRRRPQKTRFSTRSESPTHEEAGHRPRGAGRNYNDFSVPDFRGPSYRDHSELTTDAPRRRKAFDDSSNGKPRKSPRYEFTQTRNASASSSPEEVIDLTEPDVQGNSTPREQPRWREERSGSGKKDGKRVAPEPDTPSKRQRTFDFSEMRQVPPFTQKHGTTFSFNDVNDAINSIDDDRRPRQYNRGHRPHQTRPTAPRPMSGGLMSDQNRLIFARFTTESAVLFDKLFRMHNERVQLLEQQDLDFATAEQSLLEAESTVAKLLSYTQQALDALRLNKPVDLP